MIEELGDDVYAKATGVGLGHFVMCPVPHLEEVPRILQVERAASEQHYATKFEIVQLSGEHFRARTKLPIKALTLHDTEELLISKAKLRPCVVVCCNNTSFTDAETIKEIGGRKHLQDKSVLVAPLYGSATPDNETGFPPTMVARIRVFMYSQFFYAPKICPRTKLALAKDGVVRLDRIFSVSPSRGMRPLDLKLAPPALALLMALVRERFGNAEEAELKTVRELLLDALPEDCRPKVNEGEPQTHLGA